MGPAETPSLQSPGLIHLTMFELNSVSTMFALQTVASDSYVQLSNRFFTQCYSSSISTEPHLIRFKLHARWSRLPAGNDRNANGDEHDVDDDDDDDGGSGVGAVLF